MLTVLVICIIFDIKRPTRNPKRWHIAASISWHILLVLCFLAILRTEEINKYWFIPVIIFIISVTTISIIFEKQTKKDKELKRKEKEENYKKYFIENAIAQINKLNYTNQFTAKPTESEIKINTISSNYTQKAYQTETEKEFYKKLIEVTKNLEVTVRPQIPLSSIINKEYGQYRNELFRIIDYGIFDKEENLLLLIELNDKTHLTQERQERDIKVKTICQEAGIKIINFWTYETNNIDYIEKTIEIYL